MTSATIQQLKAAQPESLWYFLTQIPASTEAQIWYALMIAGIAGILTSYVIKWAQKQIEGNPFEYLFAQNVRGTVLSLIWLVASTAGSISLGGYLTPGGEFIGWGKVLFDGWVLGTGGDLGLNKALRPVWTVAEREKPT